MSSPRPDVANLRPAQRAQLDAIMGNLRHQLPFVAAGAIVTEQMLREVRSVLLRNIGKILSTLMITGGLSVLIPALTVAIVNAVGFTVGGVAAGSLAAAIQSVIYGGFTGGVFSMLQSFGATAVMASPVAITVASVAVALGSGYFLFKRFKTWIGSSDSPHTNDDDRGPDSDTQKAAARSAPDNDKGPKRAAQPHNAPTSSSGAGAMVRHRAPRTASHPSAASAVKHSAAERQGVTGRETSSASAIHPTSKSSRRRRKRANKKASADSK